MALAAPFASPSPSTAPQPNDAQTAIQLTDNAQDQATLANNAQHDTDANANTDADTQAAQPTNTADTQAAQPPESALPYQSDTVIVRLDDQADPTALAQALGQRGCVETAAITREDVANGFAKIQLAEGHDVQSALDELADIPGIAGAQPNFTYQLQDNLTAAEAAQATAVNDPKAPSQWALDSIDAYEAWGLAQTNKQVTVALVDSGCRTDHEDLKDNIVATYDATGKGGITDNDAGSHGTHVAGIIAARANNKLGVAGASYNAGILPVRVIDSEGIATTESLVRAYSYIMTNASKYNIKVVNMSLGATVFDEYVDVLAQGSSTDESDDESDALFEESIQKAYDAGILTVCSAGNDAGQTRSLSDGTRYRAEGAYHNYPSDYVDCAMSVIALQRGTTPTIASYSNYNIEGEKTKDISAPGSSIFSTLKGSTSSYGTKSGTSMAAPHVSAVAALVFAANPELSVAEVSDLLCDTATDLGDEGWDLKYAAGEVNAAAAVARALESSESDTEHAIVPGNTTHHNAGVDASGDGNEGKGEGGEGGDPTSANPSDPNATDVASGASRETALPRYAGATRMPIGSTCTWDLEHCSIEVFPGSEAILSSEGTTVRAEATGTGKLGIYDADGALIATKSVKVTKISGSVALKPQANGKLRLDLKKKTTKSGTSFAVKKKTGASHQLLKFKLQKDGSYLIADKYSKKYVSVKASSRKSGARIIQRIKHDNYRSQRWNIVVDSANRLSFVNVKSGKALTIKRASAKSGTTLVQQPASDNRASAQKWTLVK